MSELNASHEIDLRSRFLINLPLTERSSWNRLWYHVELAYYFWMDHLVKHDKPSVELESFAVHLLAGVVPRIPTESEMKVLYRHYLYSYKYKIPVCGLIWEVKDRILLVKNKASNKWGFPKGKLNKGESQWDCAVRETREETGHSVDTSIKATHIFCETAGHLTRRSACDIAPEAGTTTLFHIQTSDDSVCKLPFRPHCAQEIVKCQWASQAEINDMLKNCTSLVKLILKQLRRIT